MELDWLGLAAQKVSNVPVRKRHREHTIVKYLNKCILASLALVLEEQFTMQAKASTVVGLQCSCICLINVHIESSSTILLLHFFIGHRTQTRTRADG